MNSEERDELLSAQADADYNSAHPLKECYGCGFEPADAKCDRCGNWACDECLVGVFCLLCDAYDWDDHTISAR